jgi:Dyp-type peroxidase family
VSTSISNNTLENVLEDIQGIVLFGYANLAVARYLLLQFENSEKSREWLGKTTSHVQKASDKAENHAVNIAFTMDGLRFLGLTDEETKALAPEFVEGMAEAHRQRVLGDQPDTWEWGGPQDQPEKTVHAVLMLFAESESALKELKAKLSVNSLKIIRELTTTNLPDAKEHFGFRDGISNPVLKGSYHATKFTDQSHFNLIEPGEFILGLPNEYNESDKELEIDKLLRNGTYMVFRQLEQDVKGFWSYCAANTSNLPSAVHLASKMVGRWPSGTSFENSPMADGALPEPDNDFLFAKEDLDGMKCPIASHIRRTFPRDTLTIDLRDTQVSQDEIDASIKVAKRHRILRRSRPYGEPLDPSLDPAKMLEAPETEQERGIYFICFNASLNRQFEFVQQTWCNNPKFMGLYSDPDPIVRGIIEDDPTETSPWTFTYAATPVRRRVCALPRFVLVRGGAYFFVPGIAALSRLGLS